MKLLRACGVVLLCSSAAAAQPDAAARKAEADKLFREGYAAAAAKDFEKGRQRFLEAYAKYPSTTSLLNLAGAEMELGRVLEAIKHYRVLLAMPDSEGTDRTRPIAQKALELALGKVCRIEVHAPDNTVVTLDGSVMDAPEAMPGSHVAELRGPETRRRTFECEAGKKAVVEYGEPVPVPTASVSSRPPRPPPRTEQVRGTAGYVVPAAMLGVGATGLVLGGVFAGASNGAKSDAESIAKEQPCATPGSARCDDLRDAIDKQNSRDTLSKVFLVAGGVLTVASVATFFLWPKSTISVTPTHGGFQLSGRF